MTRGLVAVLGALAVAAPASAAVRIVEPFPLDRYVRTGAIGLAVPGAGPTVTRKSALDTLLTGEVRSSLLGGTTAGTPLIALEDGPPPDTLVVLPPAGRTENRRYPIAVVPASPGVLTSDSTRIDGLVSLADVAHGNLEVVDVADPVATLERLEHRIERNDRIRLPLTILAGALAYIAALFVPRFGPRVFLLALAANLWLAGWWVVALVAVAALALPVGLACTGVLAAYLLVLGLDPAAVAISPFGPSQAGRFYGVSNLLETMLLVPALVGAARVGRAGPLVGALALVTVAGSRFGADGGGLLVLLAAYATLALRTTGARLGAGRLALVAAGAVALGVVLVGIDAALGGSSHVTRAVGDGPGAVVGDLGDRLEISWERTFAGVGPAFASLASLAVLLFVASRRPRGPLTDALLVGILVSLLVNDTPGDVLGIGAAAAFTLWRFERRPHDAPMWRDRLRAMRRPITYAALALVALVLGLAVAACSEGVVTATPETVEGTLPKETTGGENADLPALKLKGDATAGKQVFETAGCTACHTLSAAGSSGTVGPNLDEAKPSFELVVQRVTLGQGGMPSFKDQLESQQIADVAQFVSTSAGG
ncbi:c-type cytochrome [Gaiella sp.]|uniref:c-type cytochrome n=1 Tax=Gaiella sp. TaxID=2663207 RepID=UPI002E2FF47A|nr:c-type cytochrome [Gaiella sp.]HEX5583488.1 c-type cytochrome [Gaiella sp.]